MCILYDLASSEPPSFTSNGHPPVTEDGDYIFLPCGVTGTPTPAVTWFRNGVPISQESVMDNGTLYFRAADVEEPHKNTNYYCVATNRIGRGNSTIASLRSRDVIVNISCKL